MRGRCALAGPPASLAGRLGLGTTGSIARVIIPPRGNAEPWKTNGPGARGRDGDLRAMTRFGRTLWRRWFGYHRRSRAETKSLGTSMRNALPASG